MFVEEFPAEEKRANNRGPYISPEMRDMLYAAGTRKFNFLNSPNSAQGLQGKDLLDFLERQVDLLRVYRQPELLAARKNIEDMMGQNLAPQAPRDELLYIHDRLQYLATEQVAGGQWTFSRPWIQRNGWRELVSTACLFSYDTPSVWFDWPLDQNACTKLQGWFGQSPIRIRWAEPCLDYLCFANPTITDSGINSALRYRMGTVPNVLYDNLALLDQSIQDLPEMVGK